MNYTNFLINEDEFLPKSQLRKLIIPKAFQVTLGAFYVSIRNAVFLTRDRHVHDGIGL